MLILPLGICRLISRSNINRIPARINGAFPFSFFLLCYKRLILKSIFIPVIDCLNRLSSLLQDGFRQFQELSGLYPDLGGLSGLPALWLVDLVNLIPECY